MTDPQHRDTQAFNLHHFHTIGGKRKDKEGRKGREAKECEKEVYDATTHVVHGWEGKV